MSDQLSIDGDDSFSEGISLREFARRIGVSHTAVVKAAHDGRLNRSVTRTSTGRPAITDVELAKQEWAGAVVSPPPIVPGNATPEAPKTLAAARLQKTVEQLRGLRLENDVKEGKLAPVAEMERRYTTRVVAARTRLLGVPSRAKQRLPHLTTADLAVIDGLIRESLAELAGAPSEINMATAETA